MEDGWCPTKTSYKAIVIGLCSIGERIDKTDQCNRLESSEIDPINAVNLIFERSTGHTMEQRQSFQQMVLQQLDVHMKKKKELHTDLIPFTKTNSEWVTDSNIKYTTIKLLEDNTGENLDDLGVGSAVLDTTPKAQSLK